MAAKKGKPMPKGEALETLLAGIIAARSTSYETRFAESAVSDGDLDDLF